MHFYWLFPWQWALCSELCMWDGTEWSSSPGAGTPRSPPLRTKFRLSLSLSHTHTGTWSSKKVLCPLNTLPPQGFPGVQCLRFCAFTAVEPEPGMGSSPGWGTKILHAMGHGQIITVELRVNTVPLSCPNWTWHPKWESTWTPSSHLHSQTHLLLPQPPTPEAPILSYPTPLCWYRPTLLHDCSFS